jgi:hypothetical protein
MSAKRMAVIRRTTEKDVKGCIRAGPPRIFSSVVCRLVAWSGSSADLSVGVSEVPVRLRREISG